MRSSSALASAAVLLLLGVVAPRPAVGQDEPEEKSGPSAWLCPMPVVGMSPNAARREMQRLRRVLEERPPSEVREPCINPLVQWPADRTAVIRLPQEKAPFYWPVPDMFGRPDSLPPGLRPPLDSVPTSRDPASQIP
jgi:hypothetical protein